MTTLIETMLELGNEAHRRRADPPVIKTDPISALVLARLLAKDVGDVQLFERNAINPADRLAATFYGVKIIADHSLK